MNKTDTTPLNRPKKIAVIARLLSYLFKYKSSLALAAFLTISANLLALVAPKLSGYAIDAITDESGVNFSGVYKNIIMMLVCYIFSAVLSYILSVLMINISRKVMYNMRREVFEKLLDLPVGYFDSNQTGDLVSRLSYDIDTINASLSNDLVQICAGVITVLGAAVMMIRTIPVLMLIYVITIPALILFTRYRVKKVKPLFRARSAKLGELNGYAEEMLSGQKTTRAYGIEDVMIKRFDAHNEEACKAYYTADYQGSVIGPSVNFVNNFTLSLICTFGVMLYVLSGGTESISILGTAIPAVTLASLSTFILYSRKFLGPINETANIISDIQSATSAAERIFRLLDQKAEMRDSDAKAELEPVYGNVTIKDVSFSYTPDVVVIKNLNLKADAGKTIAIVGPTGGGKTTIVNLLMRFYELEHGKILLESTDEAEVSLSDVRKQYSMVLQDTWLFEGTIAENISYGCDEMPPREEIIKAAKTARIHDYIMTLPNGYDTLIDESGTNISKGQKQLLTIARILMIKSPILILDEATSNVDSHTEKLLQEAMNEVMKDKTCFVIAHRLSTIRNADKILVIHSGEIAESGTHDELIAKKGYYSALYNSQFDT